MEQKNSIEFSNKKLLLILLPLVLEQLLNVAVGMADTVMVSSVGESAVSGVSLVDTINILLISVFMSLTTGGYVIISQALGKRDEKSACEYGNQMVLIITIIASIVMMVSLVFNNGILNLAFKNAEDDVMVNAKIYFYLTAIAYPFFAIQSACSAVFRSMGKTKITLYVSILMNLVNVVGNYIFIMLLGWNAAGVGERERKREKMQGMRREGKKGISTHLRNLNRSLVRPFLSLSEQRVAGFSFCSCFALVLSLRI